MCLIAGNTAFFVVFRTRLNLRFSDPSLPQAQILFSALRGFAIFCFLPGARPVVSPFLPKPGLVAKTLRYLGLPATGDWVADEIRLAQALD